ncbi:DUF262 domain-containing protein [Bradyrhizobium elkanii]|uniref:DUF262 domain-containing protein n=1 Tax=Bradyrhizobium elkanii TaxID=29448 RepID=UPI0009B63D2A|nr:DUF262 domain-containing protein [Bradyrhizobium elkanii]
MHYTNSEMKLDQLIGYFNSRKINLAPPFQRGHVWELRDRQRLLENMVTCRPIPAIFLYKEPDGSQFSYNILDGKQRLESLILFIGTNRPDLAVQGVKDYFFENKEKRQANYAINLDGKKVAFKDLSQEMVREFREYAIPTIEIDLDDETSLDEIINLFVDINQQGERVKRFDIVKAIGAENPLLQSVFELVASEQKRKQDIHFKKKNTVFSRVLQALQTVQKVADGNQRVDRMWERLVEVTLYCRTGSHRAPREILKSFIKSKGSTEDTGKITAPELKKLRTVFAFLDLSYKNTSLAKTRFARDLPHFYTMVTCLLSSDLLSSDGAAPDYPSVRQRLIKFSQLLSETAKTPTDEELAQHLRDYKQAATRSTTHPGQRRVRQEAFLKIMAKL